MIQNVFTSRSKRLSLKMEAARHFGKQLSFICVPISFDKVLPSDNLDQMRATFDIFNKSTKKHFQVFLD